MGWYQDTLEERFWAKVATRGPDRCWNWTGCKDKDGYGRFGLNYKTRRAHKVAFALSTGIWPTDTLCIAHECDNTACCNPGHLLLATVDWNNKDRARKGRSRDQRGSKHFANKLTEKDVVEIRGLYASGTKTRRQLASLYGCSTGNIDNIVNRKSWTHV